MGYSESTRTVEERRWMLEVVKNGQAGKWHCPIGMEKQVAYQLRECFYIIRKNPHYFPEFLDASENQEIFIAGPGEVQSRHKRENPNSRSVKVYPQKNVAAISMDGEKTVEEIQAVWESGSKEKLYFPDANLGEEGLRELHAWALENQVLMFWSNPAITLQKYDGDLVPFAFDPEEDL